MEAHVDAGSACVRLGDESWPFELDCRDASAFVEVGGRVVRVRPLRWREKLSLARFSRLGSSFVEGEQLRIALEGAPAPSTEEERAVLSALAAWVAAPGDECVPFETPALAWVTLDVCRAIGLKPADLDGRDAYEVEALWRVAAGRAERLPLEASSSGGRTGASPEPAAETWESELTRIEIVPDDASLEEPEPASEAPRTRGTEAPPEEAAAPPSMRSRAEPRRRPRELAAVRDFAVLNREAARAALPEQPESVAATPEEPVLASTGAVASYPSAPAAVSSVATPALEVRQRARVDAGWPRDAAHVGQAAETVAAASAPQPRPAPVATAEQDPERIFDELADRLERAASALGVDMEA